ncbi:1508_t:CDS:2, partial [Ambispora gerdemannii]
SHKDGENIVDGSTDCDLASSLIFSGDHVSIFHLKNLDFVLNNRMFGTLLTRCTQWTAYVLHVRLFVQVKPIVTEKTFPNSRMTRDTPATNVLFRMNHLNKVTILLTQNM